MTAQTYLLPSDHAPDCLLKRCHLIFIFTFHICSSPSSCRLQNVLPSFVDYLDRSDRGRISNFCFSIDIAIFILLLVSALRMFTLSAKEEEQINSNYKLEILLEDQNHWIIKERRLLQSSKQAVTSNKGKEKMIDLPAKGTDLWELTLRYNNKGINIGSPPRPPPQVHENPMISKSKDQSSTDMRTGIKKRKRRNKQQNVVELEPSCWNRICPQDVVDAGIHLNPAKKKHSVWFSLTPSYDQNKKNTLQLLGEPYLQIIVGIFLNGKLLAPEMKLPYVVKQWMAIVNSERKITKIGSSAENFCVKLTYARRE
ncbi:hypothetical protein Lser_V15G23202 [Lactuca serriola]